MTPKKKCYVSGSSLVTDDFNITTLPAGFHNNALLNPVSVSTIAKTEDILVTASLFCDLNPNEVSSIITVVNKEIKNSIKLDFSIPESFKTPLKALGIAEQLTLSTSNSYSTNQECCGDKIATSNSGSTVLGLKLPPLSLPIAGIPMPKKIEKFVKANISVMFSGGANSTFNGEYKGCVKETLWSGNGNINVKAALNGGAKAIMPKVFVIGGEAEGSTSITESLKTISNAKLRVATGWSGLTGKIAGFVEIPYLNLKGEFNRSRTYFEADNLRPFDINLPTIGN